MRNFSELANTFLSFPSPPLPPDPNLKTHASRTLDLVLRIERAEFLELAEIVLYYLLRAAHVAPHVPRLESWVEHGALCMEQRKAVQTL